MRVSERGLETLFALRVHAGGDSLQVLDSSQEVKDLREGEDAFGLVDEGEGFA